jgi:hypothetical protein
MIDVKEKNAIMTLILSKTKYTNEYKFIEDNYCFCLLPFL